MHTPHTDSRALLAVFVFAGGALGTSIRAALASLQPSDTLIPWATFAVNLAGALLLGFLLETLALTHPDTGWFKRFRLFAGTGLMGGFTTYGTFILEVDTRVASHHALIALAYALVSVVLGLVMAGLGVAAAKAVCAVPGLPRLRRTGTDVDSELDAPDSADDPGQLESQGGAE